LAAGVNATDYNFCLQAPPTQYFELAFRADGNGFSHHAHSLFP
jgi:hypothetical protein